MKEIESTNIKHSYAWWRDNKMLGTIILISTVLIGIFAWLNIPFLSSIHAYTIGMLMGFYNPLFYIYVTYKALLMIFGDRIKLPKWVKLSQSSYLFVCISIIFVGTSSGYYQEKTSFTSFGLNPWSSFSEWWNDYTQDGTASTWKPINTNGGLIGVFLYSIFSMALSGIGALILSIVSLVISASLLITGTSIGLYKKLINKRKLILRNKEINNEDTDLNEFIEKESINNFKKDTNETIRIKLNNTNKKDDSKLNKQDLPFDDPF